MDFYNPTQASNFFEMVIYIVFFLKILFILKIESGKGKQVRRSCGNHFYIRNIDISWVQINKKNQYMTFKVTCLVTLTFQLNSKIMYDLRLQYVLISLHFLFPRYFSKNTVKILSNCYTNILCKVKVFA